MYPAVPGNSGLVRDPVGQWNSNPARRATPQNPTALGRNKSHITRAHATICVCSALLFYCFCLFNQARNEVLRGARGKGDQPVRIPLVSRACSGECFFLLPHQRFFEEKKEGKWCRLRNISGEVTGPGSIESCGYIPRRNVPLALVTIHQDGNRRENPRAHS